MSDILKIASTGLLVSQQTLNTVASNITNVNTPGYSRQLTEVNSLNPISEGDFFVGQGAKVSGVYRVVDQFISQSLRNQQGNLSSSSAYNQIISQVDELLAQPSLGISSELRNFFSALHEVSNNADSISARHLCISQANLLQSRFNDLSNQMINFYSDINYQIETNISKINVISSQIAGLNNQIKNIGNRGIHSAPNDLLDMREQLLLNLSECIDISIVNSSDGTLNVFIASGQALVMGAKNTTLNTQINDFDPLKLDVFIQADNYEQNITEFISGGAIGGFLDVRNSVLEFARNGLGLIANTVASTINSQHQLGMDLNNDLGGNFFNDLNTYNAQLNRVLINKNNSGNAVFSVSINSVAEELSDYQMSYDGNVYTLRSEPDLVVVEKSTQPSFTIGGITINLEQGRAAPGDTFLIRPVRNGATEFNLLINDPKRLAAAWPVQAQASLMNVGTGVISVSDIVNTSGLPVSTATVLGNAFSVEKALTPPIKIQFISPTVYRVYDYTNDIQGNQIGPDQTYDPSLEKNNIFPISGVGSNPTYVYDPGYRVVIQGNPQANDFFIIDYNRDAAADNRNTLKMIDLQFQKTTSKSSENYEEFYQHLIGQIGIMDLQSEISLESDQNVFDSLMSSRNQISGVNLDEEATKLIQYEQAYQACAQVVAIARNTFEILLDAFRR